MDRQAGVFRTFVVPGFKMLRTALIVGGLLGCLVGGLMVLSQMYSTYPEFLEPGTSYWAAKLPTLIPGLLVTIGSLVCIIVGVASAIRAKK